MIEEIQNPNKSNFNSNGIILEAFEKKMENVN
jgi:hypothetical protein